MCSQLEALLPEARPRRGHRCDRPGTEALTAVHPLIVQAWRHG